MVRVVTAGHVNWDVTLKVDEMPGPDGETAVRETVRDGGGSAANVATALAGLDVPVAVVGSVGDDDPGRRARRELRRAGVAVDHLKVVEDAPTCEKYLVVDGEGEVMVLGSDGANEAVGPGDVEEGVLRAADHLHLTGQRPDTAEWLAAVAADGGASVSVDPGRRVGERDFETVCERADLVFCNDREADCLADAGADFEDCVVVVTQGAGGAAVFDPERTVEHPGYGVDPTDTTGAGDAFAAGFLSVLLGDAGPLALADPDYDRALAVGNACGALATRSRGARFRPAGDDLEAFLAAYD